MTRGHFVALATLLPVLLTAQRPDSALLANLHWRNVGPDRGGRSIAVSGVRGRPKQAYFGATGGGLWKTDDGGETWRPVTDGKITSASVGAVAVSESNPDVVFIGMGESCIRGNIMPGDGIYRSGDGGKTWTHVGFRDVDAISKIRIHPTNPDVVFAAVFGKYSVPSAERGVFKSTDGGKTWRKVLYRDPNTGAVDISIDRKNPNVMYAALWEAYRKEWQMSSGGPGSGLFKSTDGGETWTEITRNPGMPSGLVGRIGVSVSGATSNRVWALVENAKGGLFRSDDAGATWTLVNENRNIRQRAFYFTHVFADPKDSSVVYLENTSLYRSKDGGKTTSQLGGTHSDFHDLWIDPDSTAHLVVGNDGGGAISRNTGGSWTAEDFPTEQFYHIAATADIPYHICGAQQDNGTMCVPFDWNLDAFQSRFRDRFKRDSAKADSMRADTARARADSGKKAVVDTSRASDITSGGMAFAHGAGGFEPGYIAPDPRNPNLYFSGTNNGSYLDRYDRLHETHREVNPYPWFYSGEPSSEIRERWQWTFPIIFSPVDTRVLYTSSQRVWKTIDGGRTWTAISGDLTRHDPSTQGVSGGPITRDMNGPEVYGVVFALGPSKRTVTILWAGSDDGLIHVTRDGGRTWTNVTPKEMPSFGRVSQIDASPFDDATAYVAVKRPLLDDRAPYIFATHDYGRTWTRITNGIGASAYVHVVRADPKRKGMLYAGTQHGVNVSFDDGANWIPLQLELPDAPVSDIVVKENELAISTHGRGFWVLDNLAALREWTPAVRNERTHLFSVAPAVRSGAGAAITYWLNAPAKNARLEIMDSLGKVLRTFEVDTMKPDTSKNRPAGWQRPPGPYLVARAGLDRLDWDLRTQPITGFKGMILWGSGVDGPQLPPGRYTARLTVDGQTTSAPITVRRNPWITDVTDADLRAQYAFGRMVRDRADSANRMVIAIRKVKAQLDERSAKATDASVKIAIDSLRAHLSAVEEQIYQVRNQAGQDPLNFPIKVNNRLATLLAMSESADGAPNQGMREIYGILSAELGGYERRLLNIWNSELTAVNRELGRTGLPVIQR